MFDEKNKITRILSVVENITQRKITELELQNAKSRAEESEYNLNERMKELNGIYSLTALTEKHHNIEDIYREIVNKIIPESMQFPEKIYVCLQIENRTYCNIENFKLTKTMKHLSAPLKLCGKHAGNLIVAYTEPLPFIEIFEQKLINTFADKIAKITNLKLADKEKQESDKRFTFLFNVSPDPIFIVEQETRKIIEINNQVEIVYGYSKKEIIGKTNAYISAEPEKIKQKTQQPDSFIPIRYHKKKNGEIFPVSINSSVVELQNQKLLIATVHNLSEYIEKTTIFQEKTKEVHLNIIKNKESEIQNLQQQITGQSLNTLQHHTAINNAVEKLENLQTKSPELKNNIEEISNQIRTNKNAFNWENFKHNLEVSDKHFFKNLNKLKVRLSKNDIKLCAFIRLNLSSKEISKITLQTERTIEVARYRLRKKFNLGKDENLNLFLAKI